MTLRLAIAGVGHWHAPMHLDAARHAGAEVQGVWDPDPAVTAAFAAQHAAPAADSLAELIAARPDAIVVMGDPRDVPAMARACLAAGLPMVLEKPAAPATAALVALAPPAGHFIAVPLANRCSPVWPELARLGAAGRLGALVHAQFRIVNGVPDRYRADGVPWMLDPLVAGGGAMRNLGIHGIDAALMLFGAREPELLAASVRHHAHGEAVEDYAIATLAIPGGPVVTVEAGYTFASRMPGGDYEWRIAAAGATLIDRGATCDVATLDDGARRQIAPVPGRDRYRAFMAETLIRLRQGRPPSCGFADYLRAMRLIDRVYAEVRQ